MGCVKKPVAINKKHFTRDEYFKRKSEELVNVDSTVIVPDYLTDDEKMRFTAYAVLLSEYGVWSVLDAEELARYVRNEIMFERYSSMVLDESDPEELRKMQQLSNQAFDRAHKSASALCLNITGRCKVTKPAEERKNDDALPAC